MPNQVIQERSRFGAPGELPGCTLTWFRLVWAAALDAQDWMPRRDADAVLSLLEDLAMFHGFPVLPRRKRRGQVKFDTARRRGVVARRTGESLSACPYGGGGGAIGRVWRESWVAGFESEDRRLVASRRRRERRQARGPGACDRHAEVNDALRGVRARNVAGMRLLST